jgi:hypothetical protein
MHTENTVDLEVTYFSLQKGKERESMWVAVQCSKGWHPTMRWHE